MLVVDVGNSRIKWGRCDERQVGDVAVLPLDEPQAWERQRQCWNLQCGERCVIAGSNPPALQQVAFWLERLGHPVRILDSYRHLPVKLAVAQPERVGLDRLLNAAALRRRERSGPSIIVDAGSAVTVDWIDEHSVFRGGAIFPGLALMARTLNAYTAKLPVVDVRGAERRMPGSSTEEAIIAGIHGAVVGGIAYLVEEVTCSQTNQDRSRPSVYLTGGDAELLGEAVERSLRRLETSLEIWPWMTLEGIRLSAGSEP